jgi:sulfur carrier protein
MSTSPIYFTLNGQTYFTEYKLTLFELIHYFNYNSSLLVLEYNNLICAKQNWNKIVLKNNDRIEIVTIVGGG